jgi:hypothetical protein
MAIICKIWHWLICHSVPNLLDAGKYIFQNVKVTNGSMGKEVSAAQGASCLYCFFLVQNCRFIGSLTGFLEILSYFIDPRKKLGI